MFILIFLNPMKTQMNRFLGFYNLTKAMVIYGHYTLSKKGM